MSQNPKLNRELSEGGRSERHLASRIWSRLIGGAGALALVIAPFSLGSAIAPAAAAAATTTTVNSSADPSEYGSPVTFTATVSAQDGSGIPTGTVQFSLEGQAFGDLVALVNGEATSEALATTWLDTKVVTATYSGDENFSNSSGTVGQNVQPAQTTTTVNSSADPSYYGVPVTFTATVTGKWENQNPDGTVQFSIGGEAVGGPVQVVDGQATSIQMNYFESGIATDVTATYSGSDRFNGSSGEVGQFVEPVPTETTITSSQSPSVDGEDVTFTATIVPSIDESEAVPVGTVLFSVDGSPFGDPVTVENGSAESEPVTGLAVGDHTVSAEYVPGAEENFTGSAGNFTQTVKQFDSMTTLTSSANPSTAGEAVSFTATVSSLPGSAAPTGAVQFLVDGTPFGNPVALVDGAAVSKALSDLSIGTHTVTAEYSGDDAHVGSSANLSQAVVKKIVPLPPNNGGGSELANTGSAVNPLVGACAALLLLLGGAVMVYARRRNARLQ